MRTIETSLLPRFAYSTRYIAEKIPSGTATISESKVIRMVFTSAGTSEQLSEVYFSENISAFI